MGIEGVDQVKKERDCEVAVVGLSGCLYGGRRCSGEVKVRSVRTLTDRL